MPGTLAEVKRRCVQPTAFPTGLQKLSGRLSEKSKERCHKTKERCHKEPHCNPEAASDIKAMLNQGVVILQAWANYNMLHPFPSATVKLELASSAGMTFTQVCDWFKNYRRRHWEAQKDDMITYLLADSVDHVHSCL